MTPHSPISHGPIRTLREFEILEAIGVLAEKSGYPPSVREIGDFVAGSTSAVHNQVQKLRRRGLVAANPEGRARVVRLTELGCAVLEQALIARAAGPRPRSFTEARPRHG